MTKDSIKISQEINFNGLPTWVSIGASLLPEDNIIESLRSLQKDITDYQTQEQQAYSKSKWAAKNKEPEAKLTKVERQKKCITDTVLVDGPDGLLSFAFLVSNNQHLQETYDTHLKKLTDGL